MKIIVIGPHCWGEGPSVTAAKREAVKNRPRWLDHRLVRYVAYRCSPSTRVTELGNLAYKKSEPAPQLIGKV